MLGFLEVAIVWITIWLLLYFLTFSLCLYRFLSLYTHTHASVDFVFPGKLGKYLQPNLARFVVFPNVVGMKAAPPQGFSVGSPRPLKISMCFSKSRQSSKFGDNVGIWGRIMWITRKSLQVKLTKPGRLDSSGCHRPWQLRAKPLVADRCGPASRSSSESCLKIFARRVQFFFF